MSEQMVGRSRMSIASGWPIDQEVSEHRYEAVEETPITEEYEAPAFLNRETYVDSLGYEQQREWYTYETRTRQIGTDVQRHDRSLVSRSFRVRYDDGRTTNRFTPPRGMDQFTRCHAVTIRHPLLRGSCSYWLTGDGGEHGRLGIWTRLVTQRAARAARRHAADDRREIMAGIGLRQTTIDPIRVRSSWAIYEGTWDAAARRLVTRRGNARLPGSTAHLREGEFVVCTMDTSGRSPFVEQWQSATMQTPVVRRMGSLSSYVRQWWKTAALLLAGLLVAGYGLAERKTGPIVIGGGLVLLMGYGISAREETVMQRYSRRPRVLEDALGHLSARLWMRARREHDRRIGWTK